MTLIYIINKINMQNSRKLSTFQKSKKFFEENTIKVPPLDTLTPYSSQQLTSNYNSQNSYKQEQKNRALSHSRTHSQFYNTSGSLGKSSRLNPKQFTHRQVFNSKLYQTVTNTDNGQIRGNSNGKEMKKYFQISISKQERQHANMGDQLGQYFRSISQIFMNNNYHESEQLKKQWSTISHHVFQLQKQTYLMQKSSPLKIILTDSINNIEQFMIKLSALMSQLQKYQKEQELNLANLKRKKQLISELQLKQLQKQTKLQLDHNQSLQISKNKAKINQLDFQLKKSILKIQARDEQLKNNKTQIKRLTQQNSIMKKQIQNIQKWKQEYQYKIRKLKQELEVAHIVKEQNLEDKYNYILGWKL